LFRPILAAFRRRQRQFGRAAQKFALLGREHSFETFGINHLLTLFRRHGAQAANRCAHHSAPVGWQLTELLEQLPRFALLFGGQVLPGFHAIDNAVLLLRRQAVEVLQPPAQHLLSCGREMAELRIVFQRLLLLLGREIPVLLQPLPGVVLWFRYGLGSCLMSLCNPAECLG